MAAASSSRKQNSAEHRALRQSIERAFDARETISPATKGEAREAVEAALELLDKGEARVAERMADGAWQVNQWLKKAVLLSFRLEDNRLLQGAENAGNAWDKVPLKFSGWQAEDFKQAGLRAVPGAVVRRSAYIGRNVVLMPSFVNLGAHIGEGTMVDTWATVGSCAQIGSHVHLSGGVGIGGVLEPLQAGPTIIEDNCFIGARSEVVEGCIIREGAVLGMGVYIGQSTRIIDRASGEIFYGEVPPYSVVVAGSAPSGSASRASVMQAGMRLGGGSAQLMGNGEPAPHLYCAVIVKRVDAKTRAKTGINELLRA